MRILSLVWATVLCTSLVVVATTYGQTVIPVTAEQIDQIATKSDRWLFLATSIVLLGFGALVIKWLLSQLDRQRDANALITKDLVDHLKASAVEFKTALLSNTEALHDSNETNKEIAKLLQDDHRVLALLQDERERNK